MRRALVCLLFFACACSERKPQNPLLGAAPVPASPSAGPSQPSSGAPAASAAPVASEHARGRFSPAVLLQHVRALAGPELAGRKVGSAGERGAFDLVTRALDAAGVPAPASGRRHAFAPVGGWETVEGESANVYGFVAGSRPNEHVVLGAHVDHLGLVRTTDADGGVSEVLYPGAEDNASGVAVVLEVARELEALRAELGRAVLVAFFGAEEVGMLGSQEYVRTPPLPLDQAVAMVNVDMIGRPLADQAGFELLKIPMGIDADNAVGVIGTEGRPALRDIVDRACRAIDLRAFGPEDFPDLVREMLNRMARDRGDNARFEHVGVPTVFFSSGESDDYHRPSDTPDRLDPVIMAERAEVIYRTVVALSQVERATIRPP